MTSIRSRLLLITLAFAMSALYLYGLDGFGVYGPDEPRYAAIGRAMAHSGDWITPRLWGQAWFEKPPLLYWMTASGTILGLSPDLCGRLPVALLSLAYLFVSFFLLKREFNERVAIISVALLATSAWWLAFSSLCITDLPLSVFYSLAVLLALPLVRSGGVFRPRLTTPDRESSNYFDYRSGDLRGGPPACAELPSPPPDKAHTKLNLRLSLIGVCFGLAMLAKGLVPIALAIPFALFLRQYWKRWWLPCLTCLLIALPWYWAVYARNGSPFIQEFLIKHHLERVYSASLLHVQPFYYYLLIFLAALFPWTALLILIDWRNGLHDPRRLFLLLIVIWGLLFFSIPVNKLPGYLLPLIPACFALIGSAFEFRRISEIPRALLAVSAVLIACIPLLAVSLPGLLAAGKLTAATLKPISLTAWFYCLVPLTLVFVSKRAWAAALLVLCVIPEGLFLKGAAFPAIDANVSARSLWRAVAPISGKICDGGTNRDWIFGLSYYRGATFPPCTGDHFEYIIRTRQGRVPEIEPLK